MENGAHSLHCPVWWRWAVFKQSALPPYFQSKELFVLQHTKTFWTGSCSQFGDGPFLFQHDGTQGHKTSH